MKKFNQVVLASMMLVLTLVSLSAVRTAAQESTDKPQTDLIIGSCVSLNNKLQQLHSSDALLRVNMGQTYESVLTKLMLGFNGRVDGNNFNNSKLVEVTDDYKKALDKFRRDYITYEEQLSDAIKIDCRKQPVDFYDAVISARKKRNQVHEDVIKLNQYIDQYRSVVKDFETDYNAATGGGK